MNKTGLTIAFLISSLSVIGAENNASKDKIRVWQAEGPLGLTKPATIDTTLHNYHVNDLALQRTIAFQNLGNAGTAGISKIFSDRVERSPFIFFQPYSLYYTAPEDLKYFNTKIPYSNISYSNGGLTKRKQEHISGIFAINVNPYLNFGMYGKWQNNFGSYDSQSTKNYNAGFFGSYNNKHHDLMANISFNGYRAKENGGFIDPASITDPKNTGKLDAYNIPTYFDDNNVESKLVNWNAYLNYKYNIGFNKTKTINEDSTVTEFIPVSSIIYTFKNEADYRRYKESDISKIGGMGVDSLYNHLGIGTAHKTNLQSTVDSVHFWNMSHTIGITLNEEFNTIGKFGIAGFLIYDQKQYNYLDHVNYYTDGYTNINNHRIKIDTTGADSIGRLGQLIRETTTQSKVGIGAIISKRKGEHLKFNFNGEYYFKDEKKTGSSFKLGGDIKSQFNIGRNIFAVAAKASHEQYCPDYLEEHYFGNRMSWDNDFDNKKRTELEGTVGAEKIYLYNDKDSSFLTKIAPEIGLILKANETTLNNYVYWGLDAMPHQYTSNIAITSLTLQEKLKVWYLHFDNELTLQHVNTDANILDLPTLCLYSNLYLKTKPLFNVLTLQLGLDMRYNTKYYAPAYLPATGMYYAQDKEQYGDYPFYDAYLSMHLKTFRVFLEYSHLNHIWSNNNKYLISPNYASDPNYFKFGVSVNFAN